MSAPKKLKLRRGANVSTDTKQDTTPPQPLLNNVNVEAVVDPLSIGILDAINTTATRVSSLSQDIVAHTTAAMKDADTLMRRSALANKVVAQPVSSSKALINSARSRYELQGSKLHTDTDIDLTEEPSITQEMHALMYGTPLFAAHASSLKMFTLGVFLVSAASSLLQPFIALQTILIVALACTPPASTLGKPGLLTLGLVTLLEFLLQGTWPPGTVICTASCIMWAYHYNHQSKTNSVHWEIGSSLAVAIALYSEMILSPVWFASFTLCGLKVLLFCLVLVCWMERTRGFLLHPAIDFSTQSRSVHWFLLCLRLGMPGLDLKHSNVSRHLCALPLEDEESVATGVLQWLKEDHSELSTCLGAETLHDVARYIGSKNTTWIAKGAPLAALQVYYTMAKRLYMYDRYVRPYVSLILSRMNHTQNVLDITASGWRPAVSLQNATCTTLWSNPSICKNPKYILKQQTLPDMMCKAADSNAGFLGRFLSLAYSVVEYGYHDLAYNSPAIQTALMMGRRWIYGEEQSSTNNTKQKPAEEDDGENQEDGSQQQTTSSSSSGVFDDMFAAAPFYLSESEMSELSKQVFGTHDGITTCPRTDASLFYGSEHLKSQF